MPYKMLTISSDLNNRHMTVHPVLLYDKDEMILIDCGLPDSLPKLEKEISDLGLKMENLTKLIITHHDHDHMGAAAAIKEKYPNVKILASTLDAPFVEGRERSLRFKRIEETFEGLSKRRKEWTREFVEYLKTIKPVSVDIRVDDGDSFGACGGYEIVSTPGHMPGHISVYLNESKSLVCGDALIVLDGELHISSKQFSLDHDEAKRSAGKLADLKLDRIIAYHGGLYEEKDIRERLKKMSNKH